MTVSFVGAASAAATSITLPAHQAGDLIVMFALLDINGTPPAPAGWMAAYGRNLGGLLPIGMKIGFMSASSSSEVSGTWSNAIALMVAVYRSDSHYLSLGGISTNISAALVATITYPALATKNITNTYAKMWSDSAPLLLAAFTQQNNTTMEQTPAGAVTRHNGVLASSECVLHDTPPVASRSVSTITPDASVSYVCATVEIVEVAQKSTGGIQIARGMFGGMRG